MKGNSITIVISFQISVIGYLRLLVGLNATKPFTFFQRLGEANK